MIVDPSFGLGHLKNVDQLTRVTFFLSSYFWLIFVYSGLKMENGLLSETSPEDDLLPRI